jgi:hypothetical protein
MVDQKNFVEDSNTALDSVINRSLERDAQALPSFATVPSPGLAAKLRLPFNVGRASHSAVKGIFASFGSKLALFVAGAAVIGTGIYVIPKLTARHGGPEVPNTSQSVTPHSKAQPVSSMPSEGKPEQHQPAMHQSAAIPVAAQPAKASPNLKPQSPKQPLDEGDDKNAPKYIDPGYKPPLK